MLSQKVRGKWHTEPVRVIKLLHSQQIVFLFLFWGEGVYLSPSWGVSFVSLVFSHFISGSTHYYAVLRVLSGENELSI